jgi:hypothetical protein
MLEATATTNIPENSLFFSHLSSCWFPETVSSLKPPIWCEWSSRSIISSNIILPGSHEKSETPFSVESEFATTTFDNGTVQAKAQENSFLSNQSIDYEMITDVPPQKRRIITLRVESVKKIKPDFAEVDWMDL